MLRNFMLIPLKIILNLFSGSSWIIIDPPTPDEGLTQVSVGKQVVWALSRSNKVLKNYSLFFYIIFKFELKVHLI